MEVRHPFPAFRLATFILAFLALAGVVSLLRGKLRDGLVGVRRSIFHVFAANHMRSASR
jgi:hypothetical protein